jgi:hypothetical protein
MAYADITNSTARIQIKAPAPTITCATDDRFALQAKIEATVDPRRMERGMPFDPVPTKLPTVPPTAMARQVRRELVRSDSNRDDRMLMG